MPKLHKRKTIKKSTKSKNSKKSMKSRNRKSKSSNGKNMRGGAAGSIVGNIEFLKHLLHNNSASPVKVIDYSDNNKTQIEKIKIRFKFVLKYLDSYINIGTELIKYLNLYIIPILTINLFKDNIKYLESIMLLYSSIDRIIKSGDIDMILKLNELKYNKMDYNVKTELNEFKEVNFNCEMNFKQIINIPIFIIILEIIEKIDDIIDHYNYVLSKKILTENSNKKIFLLREDIDYKFVNDLKFINIDKNKLNLNNIIKICEALLVQENTKITNITLEDYNKIIVFQEITDDDEINDAEFKIIMNKKYEDFKHLLDRIINIFKNLLNKIHKQYTDMTLDELKNLDDSYPESLHSSNPNENLYNIGNYYKYIDIKKSIKKIIEDKEKT